MNALLEDSADPEFVTHSILYENNIHSFALYFNSNLPKSKIICTTFVFSVFAFSMKLEAVFQIYPKFVYQIEDLQTKLFLFILRTNIDLIALTNTIGSPRIGRPNGL